MRSKSILRNTSVLSLFLASFQIAALAAEPQQAASQDISASRVASVYVSQDFINEQLSAHSKSELVKEMKIELDPKLAQIFLRGKIQVPVEELRAINLDPKLGAFRFQVSIK